MKVRVLIGVWLAGIIFLAVLWGVWGALMWLFPPADPSREMIAQLGVSALFLFGWHVLSREE